MDTSQTTVRNKVSNILKNKLTETAAEYVLQKKVFLKISQYRKDSTCSGVSKKETDSKTGVFLWILQKF